MPQFDFAAFPILTTERTRLRQIVPQDAEAWLAVWNHPDVMRYMIDFDSAETNLTEVQGIIEWTQTIFANKTGLRWAITLPPDDTLVGTCGYNHINAGHRWGEIGYELQRDQWRRGLMREVVSEVLRFGFEQCDLHRVQADVTVGNDASAGLLRKLGFTQEGTWRDKVFARGAFHSLWQFSLLAGEWRAGSGG